MESIGDNEIDSPIKDADLILVEFVGVIARGF